MKRAKLIYNFFVLILFIFIFNLVVSVRTSAASNGTNTAGKWTSNHETVNLVALKSGTLTEQGWNLTDEVKDKAVSTENDDNLDDFEDSFGIQARSGAAAYDIGAKDYTKGVWVRITLSEADIEKAKKGDLTVNASAKYYKQTGANHYCSVQIFFEKYDGTSYVDISNIGNKTKISSNAQVLKISGKVPTDATSFRYYVSNWGNWAARPFIGDLRCTLKDTKAPEISSITFDNTEIVDKENNVAITGNNLIYDLNFNEKIDSIEKSSTYTGVATLMFEDGTDTDLMAEPTLIHENGKSKVRYVFTLPDLYRSGKVYLANINYLKVLDEGHNATLIRGNMDTEKIQYYKKLKITAKVTDLTYGIPREAKYNTDLTARLTPKKGYDLPSSIIIYAGTTKLKTTQYTYNKTTGIIVINGKAITDDIKIQASGVAKKINVVFDKNGGTNGSNSVTATYFESMPQITIPTRKGYTFLGYYENENAQGRKYYNADGSSATTCYKYENVTLYAAWEANTYSVIYDKNKPTNASGEVNGDMANSNHTYDRSKALTSNLYSLEGYTFKGWATSSDGLVVYANEANVLNLRESGNITLYAVWVANNYQIKYNSNKPLGSTSNVYGSMSNSNYTYDSMAALLDNEYFLSGYTFKGWSKSQNGVVDYKDGEIINNLSSENNDVVNLYAVWEANKYQVRYNSNKPLGTSSVITGMVDSSIHTYDKTKMLNTNNYFLTGYTFKGWSTSADGIVVYKDKQTITNLTTIDGNVIDLYAIWEANEYSITFNTAGGSFVNKMLITYDAAFLEITPPARKGYNFKGYYTLPNGEGVKYYNADGTAIFTKYNDGDLTLYANWSPIVYNIELYSEGVYVGILKDVVYGYMHLPTCQDLGITKANYDFVGWNIYEDQNWSMYNANVDYKTGLGEYNGQTVILHAAWLEKNIYSINYNANGGIGAPGMMQAHEDETIILSALTPTKDNYKFLGWSTDSNSTIVEYLPGATFTMKNSIVTLYAIWELNPSLVYDANGGKFINQIETLYLQEGTIVTIISAVPVLDGYVFTGWNENKDATVGTYNDGDVLVMPSTNTTLYAIWEKAEYAVTTSVVSGYEINGLLLSYQYNDVVTFSISGVKPKVYVNGELIVPVDNIYSFVITKDTKLIVKDGSKVSLIYSGNGGINEPIDNDSYEINSSALISTICSSRTGYEFVGWSTNSDSSISEYNPGDLINFSDEDIILYAVWKANTYHITYNANGGTGTMSSDLLLYDDTVALSNNTYKKNGYTFQGWALDPTGKKLYNDGEEVVNLSAVEGDEVTLYAVWKKTVTKINFVTIAGIETNTSLTVDYGTEVNTNSLVKPSREGYIFLGYYTGINGSGELMIDENLNSTLSSGWTIDVESITLYSYWKPITYSIIYMNGQMVCNEQKVAYDSQFSLLPFMSMEITAPKGYHFAGWSTIPSSKTIVYNDNQNMTQSLEKTDGSKVYLYAVFEINKKYNINYNANGGINAPIDTNSYYVGDIITIPSIIPTLEGYIFAGWSYDYKNNPVDFPYLNGAFEVSNLPMIEEGITLYAVWIEEQTLQSQIDQVNSLINQLQSSIKNMNNDFTDNINQLTTKIQEAQDILDTLGTTYVTYKELTEAITKLKNELLLADRALQDAINKVQTNLDTAITNLNDTISNNKEDIENKLNEVIKAYEQADLVINGKIKNLENKDKELTESITNLDKAYQEADRALQDAINKVQTDLNNAVTNLNISIENNKQEVNDEFRKVKEAYEAANVVINSKFDFIARKNKEFKDTLDTLKSDLEIAEEKIWKEINKLQEALGELKGEMNQKDTELEEMIKALTEDTKKNDNHLRVLCYINLGLVGVLALIVIIFWISYLLHPIAERKLL